MSSESEDIDEDELLQIALREQSQRDIDYQKGRSSKPVANFVQPPPPQSSSQAQSAKGKQQPQRISAAAPGQRNPSSTLKQRRVVEDDDDSELEMLSISSGDEEPTKDRRVVGRDRPGRTGRAEGSWDGDEPDCWKRVDEDELYRRVREMRETRAVHVAQKFQHKTSFLDRKGLTNIQSLPRGVECVDPLGLG